MISMYRLIKVITYVLIGFQVLSYIMIYQFDISQFRNLSDASITANLTIVFTSVIFSYLKKKEVLK